MTSANAATSALGFELQRRFRASPERVFRAWTQPAALREWWCPAGWTAGEIEVDLRVGGAYRIAMIHSGRPSFFTSPVRWPVVMSANAITPMVFCASLVPCARETSDALPIWPQRK